VPGWGSILRRATEVGSTRGFFFHSVGSPPKKLNFIPDVQFVNVTRLGLCLFLNMIIVGGGGGLSVLLHFRHMIPAAKWRYISQEHK
jgi:hypothetical protein